jgi:hypothetical protein
VSSGHVRAILWVRWRLLLRRTLRAGKLSNTVCAILVVLGALACLGSGLLSLVLGYEILHEGRSFHALMVWGVLTGLFLLFWLLGLVMDLQRAESMSFRHLLHLPVPVGWVFVYNYLGSLVSASIAFFLPAMVGLALALSIAKGPRMLLVFPLAAAFLLMVTALTHQLRGWVARLMEDPRRGRNVIVLLTIVFVLLLQAPNLVNLARIGSGPEPGERVEHGESGSAAPAEAREVRSRLEADGTATAVARFVPFAWLAYGVHSVWERRWLHVAGCFVGMLTIATWSLRRAWRTTRAGVLGLDGPTRRGRGAGAGRSQASWLDRNLPFADEREAAIARAALRSLIRAPEAKLAFLSPLIVVSMFGFLLWSRPDRESMAAFAPLMTMGAALVGQMGVGQLSNNTFGLDRDGFRSYLLSPVPRHRILRGKNLALAPVCLGIGLVALGGLWLLLPLGPFHVLGACLQLGSVYLISCLGGNLASILFPMRLRENSLRAHGARLKPILSQVFMVLLMPVTLVPLLLPAGADFLMGLRGWELCGLWFLLLHGLLLAAVVFLYARSIRRQGDLLQSREQGVLEVLTQE